MKMKKFTFVLALTFISTLTFAQTLNFYQDGDTIKQNTTIGDQVDFKGHVINLTSSDITSTWSVTNVNFPNQTWQFYVCDNNLCYGTGVASKTQTIVANDTALLKTTIISGNSGVGSLTIKTRNDATGESHEFRLTLDATTSTHHLANVVVFSQNAPNPFDSYTRVNYDLKGNSGQIVVTDVAGRQLSVYNLNDNAGQIEIGQELGRGIYFYTLTVDGTPVMTKRLQKL
jgi:hypothetical protein